MHTLRISARVSAGRLASAHTQPTLSMMALQSPAQPAPTWSYPATATSSRRQLLAALAKCRRHRPPACTLDGSQLLASTQHSQPGMFYFWTCLSDRRTNGRRARATWLTRLKTSNVSRATSNVSRASRAPKKASPKIARASRRPLGPGVALVYTHARPHVDACEPSPIEWLRILWLQ